jgi:hypothetical protein
MCRAAACFGCRRQQQAWWRTERGRQRQQTQFSSQSVLETQTQTNVVSRRRHTQSIGVQHPCLRPPPAAAAWSKRAATGHASRSLIRSARPQPGTRLAPGSGKLSFRHPPWPGCTWKRRHPSGWAAGRRGRNERRARLKAERAASTCKQYYRKKVYFDQPFQSLQTQAPGLVLSARSEAPARFQAVLWTH